MNSSENGPKVTVFDLDGRPPLSEALPVGMQHILAVYVGNIAPVLIIAQLAGLGQSDITFLVQCTTLLTGLIGLVQIFGLGPFGARLPIVMCVSSAYIGIAAATIAKYGSVAPIFGGALITGLFVIGLGRVIKKFSRFLPPLVSGVVLICLGITLIRVGIIQMAGGGSVASNPDFGAPVNIGLALFVLITVIILQQQKGLVATSAVLIAIIAGYIAAAFMGLVSLRVMIESATRIQFPVPFRYWNFAEAFKIDVIIPMLFIGIINEVASYGKITGIAGIMNRPPKDREISGGIMAVGLGTAISSLFCVFPCALAAQNVGLVNMTKAVNRFSVGIGSIILIVCALFPPLNAVVAAIPLPVLGGVTTVMFGSIFVSGLQLVIKDGALTARNALIVAVSIGLGLGFELVPGIFREYPSIISFLFTSSITVSGIVAIILNICLPSASSAVAADKEKILKETLAVAEED
jgi:uracil-xanthine permease